MCTMCLTRRPILCPIPSTLQCTVDIIQSTPQSYEPPADVFALFHIRPIQASFPSFLQSTLSCLHPKSHEPPPMCATWLPRGPILTPFPRILHSPVDIVQSTYSPQPRATHHVCALSGWRNGCPAAPPPPPIRSEAFGLAVNVRTEIDRLADARST